jgi:putative component of toxin-antitoxin plasmid stabilization module
MTIHEGVPAYRTSVLMKDSSFDVEGIKVYSGLMLLIGGGDKGSQARDIEKARELWRQANASA